MQRAYAPLLRPLGITYLQYLVLLVLLEGDGVALTEIGRRLFLDSGTLTPVLRRLERQGFVSRRRAEHDEREVRIALTPAARRLEPEFAAIRAQLGCRFSPSAEAFWALRDELRDLRARLAVPAAG